MRILFYCLLVTCFAKISFAQSTNKYVDSVWQKTDRIISCENKINKLIEEIEICWRQGYYAEGLELSDKSLVQANKCSYLRGAGKIYMNRGIVNDFLGNYSESIHDYLQAVRIQIKIKDEEGLAETYNNMGLLYNIQAKDNPAKNEQAEIYFLKSLKIHEKRKNLGGISKLKSNLAIIYMEKGDLNKALNNYLESVSYDKKMKNEVGMADTYNNIGLVYLQLNEKEKAKEYFERSLVLRKKINDINGVGTSYNNLATLYYNNHQDDQAEIYFQKAIEVGRKIGSKKMLEYAYENLSVICEEKGNAVEALEYYKEHIKYKDSIMNEGVTKSFAKEELEYIFDLKVAKEMHRHQALQMAKENKIQRQRFIIGSSIGLIVVIVLVSIVVIRKWRGERKQNLIIEQQKDLVDEKNKEILASITYAQRIQSAILPQDHLLGEHFENLLVIYLPKDIVAGDFYWIEPVDKGVVFAVADCTGHGVPGAMMSVLCHNALNRSIREYGLREPGRILDQTRKIILEEFSDSKDEVYDGMDISLCYWQKEDNTLQWAGANNPLWYIKKGETVIREFKPMKQPIGRHSFYEPFETHEIQCEVGDSLYLFTDGFADQFGGKNNKKYKSVRMKDLFLSVKDLPMWQQKEEIRKAFDDWKGEGEQVDDVCVMGIRL